MAREVDGELFDDEGVSLVRPEVSALEAISRSEVAMQLDAAHRWPRSIAKFIRSATELATYDEDVAASCMYSVPRAGKMIHGKSIRLAEICASCWGNLHVGSRVVDTTDDVVVGQSVAWDLERNVRVTIEAQRGIRTSKGKRYDEDMIRTTGMAAISIAMRNAVFRVVPQAYANKIYGEARAAAVGDVKTLAARRDKWIPPFLNMGVTPERLFARLGVRGVEDIGLDHIATLIGLASAIKAGDVDIDDAFPPVPLAPGPTVGGAPAGAAAAPAAEAPEGRRVKVGPGKRGAAAPPPPAAAPNASGATPAAEAAAPKKAAPAPAPAGAAAPPSPAAAAAPSPATPSGGAAPQPEGPAAVDPAALLLSLALVDETWKAAPDGAAIIETWSEADRRAAWSWSQAVINDAPFDEQMRRPAFTNIDAPPEDDQ